jgi:hypothetical protein
MFSCLGRGEGLYGKPDFDSQLFRRYLKEHSSGRLLLQWRDWARGWQYFSAWLHLSLWNLSVNRS